MVAASVRGEQFCYQRKPKNNIFFQLTFMALQMHFMVTNARQSKGSNVRNEVVIPTAAGIATSDQSLSDNTSDMIIMY